MYIKDKLNNPIAAYNTIEQIVEAAEKLEAFPYSNPVYTPIRPLKKEYRKIPVKNYMLFYTVDETEKLVTVSRVIYARRNLSSQITE